MATRSLIFDIFAIDRASAVFSRVGTEAELSGSKVAEAGRKAAAGFIEAAAIIGFGTASVKAASDFQASMQRISTLAMGGQAPIASLSKQVLALAGHVGYDPNSLSDALYHIESNFYTVGLGGQASMNALTVAAKGAQIGGADLVDVTNALGAAIASGIPGVHNYNNAMQMLLTTVGIGDMKMQDLADAFSTGILAVVKQYGATLNDVSASLATFGDNNIRGQVAATDLRMAVMDLTKQSKTGASTLDSIGIKAGELGGALQKGGLNAALIDLRDHLNAAGIKGVEVGQFLENAFTKKSSAPLAILLGQFDRLQSKYAALQQASGGFDSAWAARQKTSAQNFADLKGALDSFKVVLGDTIIPALTKFTGALSVAFTWMSTHQVVVTAIAGAFAGVLLPALIGIAGALGLIEWPILAAAALGAGLAVLYQHSAKFRDIVQEVGHVLSGVLKTSIDWLTRTGLPAIRTGFQVAWNAAGAVINWFINGPLAWIKTQLAAFENWYHAHAQQIATITRAAWLVVSTEVKIAWAIIRGIVQVGATTVVSFLRTAWGLVRDGVRLAWDAVRDIVKTTLSVLIDAVSMFTNVFTGHWRRAWSDAKKLVSDGLGGINKFFADFTSNALSLLFDAGKNIIQGLINGMGSMLSAAKSTASSILKDVAKSAMSAVGIQSPSKVFHGIGVNIGQGLINGMGEKRSAIKAEITAIANDITAVGTKIQAAQQFSDQWTGNVFSGAMQALSASTSGAASSSPSGSVFAMTSLTQPSSASKSPLQAMIDYATQQATQAVAMNADVTKLQKLGASPALLAQLQAAGPDAFSAIDALANGGAGNVSTLNGLLATTQANSLDAGSHLAGAKSFASLQGQAKDEARLEKLLTRVLNAKGTTLHVTDKETLAELKALTAAIGGLKSQGASQHKASQAQAKKAPDAMAHAQTKTLNHQARRAKNR